MSLTQDERYRALFEQADDALILYDLNRERWIANPAALDLLGYTSEQFMQLHVSDIVVDAERAISHAERLLRGEAIPLHERRFRHKDGTIIPCEVSATLVRDDEGQALHIQGMLRDLRPRRAESAALRQSEARFRALFERSRDAVFIFDFTTDQMDANQSAADLFGYTREEISQMSIRDLSAEPDASEAMLKRVNAGETLPLYRRRFKRKDGNIFLAEVTVSTTRDKDGTPLQSQSIVRDISQQQAALDALQTSEERYRSLFEESHDAIFIRWLQEKGLEANQRAAAMLGYSLSELRHLSTSEISVEPSASDDVIDRLFAGEQIAPYERLFRRKDGSIFPVEISVSMAYDNHGEPLHIQSIVRDLSEQKAAAAQLQESEARFRALFQQTHDGVTILGLDGQVIDFNERAAEFLGYSRQELLQTTLAQTSAEVDASRDVVQRLLAGEDVPLYVRQSRHRDGHIVPLEISAMLVRDKHGEPLYIMSLQRDLSERQRAEAALRERDARYRALFEQSHDGISILDLEGRTLDVNQRLTDLLGFSRDELLAQDYLDASAEPDGTAETMSRLLAGEIPPIYERDFWHKDGHTVTMEVSAMLVRNEQGEPLYVQSLLRDISERKATEAALRTEQQRYRALFEQSQDSVAIMSLDGRTLDINPRGVELFGYTPEEVRRMESDAISLEPEASHEMGQRLRRGEQLPLYERKFRHKDGHVVYGEVNNMLVRDDAGNPLYVQSVVRDISERKRADAALRAEQARYQALFEQSGDAIFLLNREGQHVQANRRAVELLGYDRETLQKIDYRSISDNPDDSRKRLGRVFAGEHLPSYERELYHASGRVIPVEIWLRLIQTPDDQPDLVQSIVRDLTERKAALAALRTSDARYRALFHSAHDAISIFSLDGYNIEANAQVTDLLGYSSEELQALRYSETSAEPHPSDDIFERLVAGEQVPLYERVMRHKDGHDVPVEVSATLVRDDDGTPLYIQSIVRDLTERKAANEQLRENERRYRTLFEEANDAIFISTIDGTMLSMNPSAERLVGYTFEELHNAPPFTMSAEVDQSLKQYQRALAGEKLPLYERRLRHKDGQVIPVEVSLSVVRDDDGEPLYVQSITRDLTERYEMNERLRRYDERYRMIVNSLSEGVLQVDAEGQIETINAAACKLLGIADEASAQGKRVLGIVQETLDENEHVIPLAERPLQRVFRTGQPERNVVIGFVHEDARTTWLSINVLPLHDPAGALSGALLSFSDITALRAAQKTQIAFKLEQERVNLITNFMQDASHEFRTPLSTLTTRLHLIARSDDPARRETLRDRTEGEIQRLAHLVDMLLTMAKLDSDASLPKEWQPLLALIDYALPDRATIMQTLTLELDPELPMVYANGDMMVQALEHLMNNATRFTPPTGQINVRAWADEQQVWITIRDDGPGIAPQHLPHIYERFYRVDQAHSTPGFGLGLPIAKRIIEVHGGTLTISSADQAGTLVEVTLPRHR